MVGRKTLLSQISYNFSLFPLLISGDGAVDMDEFVQANASAAASQDEEHLRETFKKLDKDGEAAKHVSLMEPNSSTFYDFYIGDGELSSEEIAKFCKFLSKEEVDIPPQPCFSLLGLFDIAIFSRLKT